MRIDSSLHAAHGMLSDLYGSEQLLDLAIVHIRRAIDRVPGGEPEAAYLRRYAQLLCRVDQPGQALAVLRRLPVEKHLDPEVMGEMAACWDALGQPEKAARQYEQALRLQPCDEGAAAAAAEWYLRAQDEMSARRMIEQLRHINPASTRLPLLRKRLEQVGAAGQP